MEFSTGNSKVDAMAAMQLTGNVIPQVWYKTILRENGKPDLLGITILADICYWYRPAEIRDEQTGQFLGYAKKFNDKDMLQRSYSQFADMFGESKRSITDAIVRLEKLGVIKRVFRTIEIGGILYNNVLFIDLFPEVLYKLTYPEETEGQKDSDTPIPKFRERGHEKKGEGARNLGRQNTKNTTENTTKNFSSSSNSTGTGTGATSATSSEGGDDDNRIRERLTYETVRKKCPDEIVAMVFDELKNRPDNLLHEISATDFRTICENISLYVQKNSIYNKQAFVRTCLNNLVSCRGKPRNQFMQFEQHDYDFEAIEAALLSNQRKEKKHEFDR